MSTTCGHSDPPPSDEDPTFAPIIAALMAMPEADRNALLAFFGMARAERNAFLAFHERWQALPRDRRAVFAMILWPDLRDEDIAALLGVCSRTLTRCEEYCSSKATLEDYRHTRRKPCKRRKSNSGGWWETDHPDH